ncbi:hypothetical protein RC77_09405 [Pectobacterium brasiliense]|nr:hypothetical protein RC77_09405 [Pectobacterium brasiliense]
MNKIQRPEIDDHTALHNLSINHKVGSYPYLQSSVATIRQGYTQYESSCGNAFLIENVSISPEIAAHLKSHYKAPPKDLKHIITLRKATEHHTCPMCGSFHRGTLDHLLPQGGYAAFTVFSLNLVPACKCNSKRQDVLIGSNPNERILHPYFDDCLTERLIAAHFEDLGPIPKVKIRLCVDNTHPEYPAIAFHFRTIVEQTAITHYLRDRWIDMCRKPSLIVRELKLNPSTLESLRKILEEELDMLDDTHRSKNNWNSIFMAGLLDPNVLHWLFQQIHILGRPPNGPLV